MSDLEAFRQLIPINALSDDNARYLLERARIEDFSRGETVFQEGSSDRDAIYLLSGMMGLHSAQLSTGQTIEAGTEAAYYAMAQIRPRQYTGKALDDTRIVRVDLDTLERVMAMEESPVGWEEEGSNSGVEVEDLEGDGDSEWFMEMLRNPAFDKLPTTNFTRMLAKMELVEYAPGDFIIKQGEQGDYYYVVREGVVEVQREGMVLADMKQGEVFGEESLLTNAERNADVVAKSTPCKVMRLTRADFNELLRAPLIRSVTLAEAKEKLADNGQMLDVRTKDEFYHKSFHGSVNLPLSELRSRVEELDKRKEYVICCQLNKRSAVAAFLLSQRGYSVYLLQDKLFNLSL